MPLSPSGSLAVQVKSRSPPCVIVIVMSVVVRTGFTPVQFGFGQPAAAPDTVSGAVKTAGLVVKLTLPFLIWSAGMIVGAVTGPTRTLFWPGAVLPPWFWHW